MQHISLREFRFPQDYPAALCLWQAMEKGVRAGRSDTPAEIEKKLGRDPDLFLVAEVGGGIVGTVVGGFDGRRGMIYHLAVDSAFRGRGIGGLLMDEVERRLKAKGCRKCYLMVTPDNTEAMRYYERRGWTRMQIHPYAKDLDE
jgi:ribosomal protein S18 acetylase RimI-like enzyme